VALFIVLVLAFVGRATSAPLSDVHGAIDESAAKPASNALDLRLGTKPVFTGTGVRIWYVEPQGEMH
jgi:hypothetical protein